MARALVVTVGTGTRPDRDIVRPLVKTVHGSNPELVVFLVTKESEGNARRVSQELGLPEGRWELVHLEDENNVNLVFQRAMAVLRSLEERGFAAPDVELDYTSGTKSMSAGAVLAGVAARCGALKYVAGRRESGVVIDGTEEIRTMEPGAILAHQEVERARALFQDLRFAAALALCRGVNRALVDEATGRELEDLEKLIQGYDHWDKFDHRRAAGELGKVDFGKPRNRPFRVSKEVREGRLVRIGKAIEQGEITEDLLADLANNALRRWREGKYDDAVARLYRLVEMVGQRSLWRELEIRAGDVEVGRAPKEWQERLETHRDPKDGKIKIGLVVGYGLLADRDSPVGLAFKQNKKLAGLLSERNDSILAHGTHPVRREACRSLCEEVLALVELAAPGFTKAREELQFPWLSRPDL